MYEAYGKHMLLIGLLMFAASKTTLAEMRELVILHTNDVHARISGVKRDDSLCQISERVAPDCFGGFDRIMTQVEHERAAHKNVIVVDAGDQFQGTPFHLLYKGMASAILMNMIRYDAMVLGNHEFDNGQEPLHQFASTITFPLISANIDVAKSSILANKIHPYVIKTVSGIRVGILGYTTEDTAHLSNPGAGITFVPTIARVKETVARLKKEKVDVIIAVSHSGLNKDIEVAKNVDGIAAIVCGHSNSLLSNTAKDADGPSPLVIMSPSKKPVLLVSAYAYGKYLGKLKFAFDELGVPTTYEGEPILLDQRVARNQAVMTQIDKLYAPIEVFEKTIVGTIDIEMDYRRCRDSECPFGNLITESMLDYTRAMGTEIALMNGGGIRAPLPKGSISEMQLKNVLPIDKTLVLLKLSGAVIINALEHGVGFAEDMNNDNTGRFLQVSGLRYSFDTQRPRGMRIKHVLVFDKERNVYVPIDPKKTYSVVTNSYLARGGDGYSEFAHHKEQWTVNIELKEMLKTNFEKARANAAINAPRIVNLAQPKTASLVAR